MDRLITSILIVILLLSGGIFLLFYLSHGVVDTGPKVVRIEGLHERIKIGRDENGAAVIEADIRDDLVFGSGYAHGSMRAWWVTLLRQAALGRLGEWFGDDFLEVDRLSRALLFGTRARDIYDSLTEREKTYLVSFSEGLNTALDSKRIRLTDEFVLFDIDPEPWEPWHTLAIERLMAWMCLERPETDHIETIGETSVRFWDADLTLRRLLHLHSFSNSLAWVAGTGNGVSLYQRQVYGAAAVPFFLEMTLISDDNQDITGIAIPGTPFLIAGKNESFAWSILLSGQYEIERRPVVSDESQVDYQRIYGTDSREYLVPFVRTDSLLLFVPFENRSTDAVGLVSAIPDIDQNAAGPYALSWPGLTGASDLSQWISLLESQLPDRFSLFDGNAVFLHRDGSYQTRGRPGVVYSTHTGVALGSHSSSSWVATRLDSLSSDVRADDSIGSVTNDVYSIWADSLWSEVITGLSTRDYPPGPISESLTYLRNWNFTFNAESIGASIFDVLVARYRAREHSFPAISSPDSLLPSQHDQILVEAVRYLTDRYGDDLSQWRWENVVPDRFMYPIFSEAHKIPDRLSYLASTRYAPFSVRSSGHPTTVSWGTSIAQSTLSSPAVWESWINTASWDTYHFRRQELPSSAFLDRNMMLDQPPVARVLSTSPDVVTLTTLVPE